MCCFSGGSAAGDGHEGIVVMRNEKHQQLSEPVSLRNIESCLLLDSVGSERTIAKAEDPKCLTFNANPPHLQRRWRVNNLRKY